MPYENIGPEVVSPHHEGSDPLAADFKYLDTVIALYDFPGTQPSHLPLDLGDTAYVLSKNESGWWDGVVVNQNGEVCRGWFPENYVRSVNYVQPVLNKLQSNKEIDSITAANTAANVLIPLFTNLLQKSLGEAKDAANTRKNSVVSFALSETSIPSEKKRPDKAPSESPSPAPPPPPPHHQQSFASTISGVSIGSGSFSNFSLEADKLKITPIDEAEARVAEVKLSERKNLAWVPRLIDNGEMVLYCEYLDMYCETIPLAPVVPDLDLKDGKVVWPSQDTIDEVSLVLKLFPTEYYGSMDMGRSSRMLSMGKSFDASKRDSSTSLISQSSALSYHNFSQPFYSTEGLFYNQYLDIVSWSELGESFNYFLDLTWKALTDGNKQLFTMQLSQLTKIVCILLNAARLTQADFTDTKNEKAVRHKIRRLSEAFAQVYINSLLHLSVMHYPEGAVGVDYLNLGIHGLNKSTSSASNAHLSTSSRGSESTVTSPARPDSRSQLITGNELVSYLQQIEDDIAILRSKTNSLIKVFLHLSKDKKVRNCDYDSSDVSEDEGIDRYNVLPQVYPRFLRNEFNGGNWCNPFFTEAHSFLNLSGDHLKNKQHLKILIDSYAYDRAQTFLQEVNKFAKDALEYLDPEKQSRYYNEALRTERNEQILRLMYKFLHHSSDLVDLYESLDFTVFCLVKKYPTAETPEIVPPERNNSLVFEYPIVLEFFQTKQRIHDSLAQIVMSSQSITLEDPDAFSAMRDDEAFVYSKEALRDPLEKSAILLSKILQTQAKQRSEERISFNQDLFLTQLLEESSELHKHMLSTVKSLIEEREAILNYATRVMHENFSVDLFVAERHNTALNSKNDDGQGQYFSGGTKNDDTPWYLEGDEEFDLLLDITGNIKGGTKEALVAQLTHHDKFDDLFNTAFLVSFATIMSISELLDLLINRFVIQAPEGLSYEEYLTWKQKKQNRVRLKVLSVMNLILESHWCSSYNIPVVLQRWLDFLELPEVKTYPVTKSIQTNIQNIIDGKEIDTEPKPIMPTEKAPAPLIKGFSLRKMRLMDIESVELARQLTLKEFDLYSKITKLSCIHKVWGKKSGLSESISNITSFIKASNQLTNFVAYLILRKDDPRKRVQVIRYFVQVAEKCRQYNNFSSMTAIISALYSSPIHRLKKTWTYVTKDIMSRLQSMNKLMNSSRNFNEYRDMLKFIRSEPCVPFFGVYLSDLTFIYHGNPDSLLNRARMINFAKRARTVNIVTGIDRFKRVSFNFTPVPEIQTFLELWFDKCPPIEEQYQLSLNIEPREEKHRRINTLPLSKLSLTTSTR